MNNSYNYYIFKKIDKRVLCVVSKNIRELRVATEAIEPNQTSPKERLFILINIWNIRNICMFDRREILEKSRNEDLASKQPTGSEMRF